jgi:hypothetical protein
MKRGCNLRNCKFCFAQQLPSQSEPRLVDELLQMRPFRTESLSQGARVDAEKARHVVSRGGTVEHELRQRAFDLLGEIHCGLHFHMRDDPVQLVTQCGVGTRDRLLEPRRCEHDAAGCGIEPQTGPEYATESRPIRRPHV